MKILFYRYGSIVEQHILDCFNSLEIEVIEDTRHMKENAISSDEIISDVKKQLNANAFAFVFSINFFPEVSIACEEKNIPYVCWTVDSPFIQLFSPELYNKCNRVFFFDYAQYERFGIPLGSNNGFYLPLAGNISHFEKYITNADSNTLKKYSSDISMVGSLYNEKNPYTRINGKSDYLTGFVSGIEAAQMKIYGENIIEKLLTLPVIQEFEKLIPDIQNPNESLESKIYKIAHFVIGPDLAYHERVNTLNLLAQNHNVDLYTLSDTSELSGVICKGSANTFTEMPIIFNQSKINLNITMRPIITGLSQRIYDVLACGGFLLTNYQAELPELFDIGIDLECYSSNEELLDKVEFYLKNDDAREVIAHNGIEKIKSYHTFEHRISDMIKTIMSTI